MPAEISLQEAAELLGVHYMTAYRYVRQGQLAARKVGAVWHVRESDLAAFRTTARPRSGRRVKGEAPGDHWVERMESRLVAGDSSGVSALADAALGAGIGIDELYLDVLAPALRHIGERWAAGELDVAHEHRATVVAGELLARLSPRFAHRGRSKGTVVLGGAAGERHALALAIVGDVCRMAGYSVDALGADVPTSSFVLAAQEADRLLAVGIGVMTPANLPAAADAAAAVRAVLPAGALLLAGGAAVPDDATAQALGADHRAADARHVLTLLASRPA